MSKVYMDKSKPIVHNKKHQKSKNNIEKPILTNEQVQSILENIDIN